MSVRHEHYLKYTSALARAQELRAVGLCPTLTRRHDVKLTNSYVLDYKASDDELQRWAVWHTLHVVSWNV